MSVHIKNEKQKYYSLSCIYSITDAIVYVFRIKILTKLPNLLNKNTTPFKFSFPSNTMILRDSTKKHWLLGFVDLNKIFKSFYPDARLYSFFLNLHH